MNRRSMGMSVNNNAGLVSMETVLHRLRIYIHNLEGFLCHRINTVHAQPGCDTLTLLEGFGQEIGLPFCGAYHGTKLLVILIVGAQGVTVDQDHPVFIELQYMRFVQ